MHFPASLLASTEEWPVLAHILPQSCHKMVISGLIFEFCSIFQFFSYLDSVVTCCAILQIISASGALKIRLGHYCQIFLDNLLMGVISCLLVKATKPAEI